MAVLSTTLMKQLSKGEKKVALEKDVKAYYELTLAASLKSAS